MRDFLAHLVTEDCLMQRSGIVVEFHSRITATSHNSCFLDAVLLSSLTRCVLAGGGQVSSTVHVR